MSSISAANGLISGLPIQELVDSLISIQRRPITQLQTRLTDLSNRRAAYLQVTSQLLSIQNLGTRLANAEFFRRSTATSSNESAIVASATAGSAVGQFSFSVKSLATTHQLISSGFATADASPVGAGTLTFESSQGTVNASTRLDTLRAQDGVQRGKFRITDRSGAGADVDLTTAGTVQDVIDAINSAAGISVSARVEGDHLVLTDLTGLSTGSLSVTEIGGGRTAQHLGLLGSSSSGIITGQDLVSLSDSTRLTLLNDGNGVRTKKSQNDFSATLADGTTLNLSLSPLLKSDTNLALLNRGGGVPAGKIKITNRAGLETEVDLSAAQTVGDVKTAIESTVPGVTVTISGAKLILNDAATGDKAFKVDEVDGGITAGALGLTGTASSGTLSGGDIFFVETLGDVRRVINLAAGNEGKLVAEISADGLGLTLRDTTAGAGTFELAVLNDSGALDDLGLTGASAGGEIGSRRLLAGLNSVLLRSLNGGSGVTLGEVEITDRNGAVATIDLAGATSLADVISAINNAGVGVTASVSDSGLGIVLKDTSGGTGNFVVRDVTGSAAADLKIEVDAAVSQRGSGNLQRQYLSGATRLSDLNGGRGIVRGLFRITDSSGQSGVIDLTQGNEVTLQDVIDEINSRGIGVTARINDNGDGLLIEDTAGGGAQLKITEEGSTTAKSLNILKTAASGEPFIDGSFERKVVISASDSLNKVIEKIKASGAPVLSALLNNGSGSKPFRLSLTSNQSGTAGQLAVDTGATGLSFEQLSSARDATVIFGDPNAANPVILSSSTNSISGVLDGVRLDLISTTTQPVTVTVSRNVNAIVEDISSFVTAFNAVISSIDQLSSFNAETETRGILNGDSTTRRVRDRLLSIISRVNESGDLRQLSRLGVSLQSGASLRLDEQKLRDAIATDPQAVQEFFTTEKTGFGTVLQDEIKSLTEADTGVIALQEDAIQSSQDLLTNRITQLETLLVRRRERLLAQFAATESIIARLQTQQTALLGLSTLSTSR
ncbi:MAG: flagellar filament capping protein FliD [Planctomycetia bacterium]|nr:flagellar filament capping protein FliD [Planctomycetia bacterium]MCC7313807.1 flagellar filament capping protein FliD [Planctomycetota bacterium]